MDCIHKLSRESTHNKKGQKIVVSRCQLLERCVPTKDEQALIGVASIHACEGCEKFVATESPLVQLISPQPATAARPKGRFCYYTGSNRANEPAMMGTMIRSARSAGVQEDFHTFALADVEGAINHTGRIDFRQYMFKVDLLQQLKHLDYDYFVWLDPDNYFVRDPGDLSELIRDNKVWVSMEGDLASPASKQKNWWGLKVDASPTLTQHWQRHGVTDVSHVWNTNAGMFIVRRDAIDEFSDRMWTIFNDLIKYAGGVTEEPPLAICGALMTKDPENNTFPKHEHIWVSDWIREWGRAGRLPDGTAFPATDWVSGLSLGKVNPAIVHLLGGKNLMIDKKIIGTIPEIKPESIGRKSRTVTTRRTIEERMIQHVTAFPCRFRGELTRVESKSGNCAVMPSPVFECSLPTNEDREASLWKFCTEQKIAMCAGCEGRELPLVQVQPLTAIRAQPRFVPPANPISLDGRIPSVLRRHREQ